MSTILEMNDIGGVPNCHLVFYALAAYEASPDRRMRMAREMLAVVGHVGPASVGDKMSSPHALAALAALGQSTRFEIFRLLIRREPHGLPAGEIAQAVGTPHNTLSSHLGILARAGLVRGARDGRSIVYRADIEGMRRLIGFLVDDCCDGHPELCRLQDAVSDSRRNCGPAPRSGKRRKRA
jgi:DNA-binding transcriptional ArsR family regulator